MIAQIITLLLRIFVEWPQRQQASAKKKWAEFRNTYDQKKIDRARRASLIESTIMRDDTKDKLQ